MKKLILLLLVISGFIGIALAQGISTGTNNGKDIVIYDTVNKTSVIMNMQAIESKKASTNSLYWTQVESAAQETLDQYEDRLNQSNQAKAITTNRT